MPDHALTLLGSIQQVLEAEVPLNGGWLATRLKTPTYPFGTIDMTQSTPQRGQKYYRENHRGVISVWTRMDEANNPSPIQAYKLSEQAHRLLGEAILSSENLVVSQFQSGALTPRQLDDGITWGRSFIFTAITHEVTNG